MASADSPLFRFTMWRAALPPALRLLLTVNLVTYVAFVVVSLVGAFGAPGIGQLLVDGLTLPSDPAAALRVPWTVLTYGFANFFGGFFGLISFAFGVYWLQWMGRDFEESYGAHRLFGLYMLAGLGGAVVGLLLGAVLPSPRGFFFGLWTPITGVLCAVATLHPTRQIGLLFLGMVPMKWIAVGFVVLSLAFSADVTVLGAALAGVLFAKAQQAGRDPAAWAEPLFATRTRTRSQAPKARAPFGRPAATRSERSASPRTEAASAPLDVDAILDKILEKGYDSLSKEEREALDRASRD